MFLVISAVAGSNNFEGRKVPPGAPYATIQGTVNDANTSLPIEGVTVAVKGTTIATKTNSRG